MRRFASIAVVCLVGVVWTVGSAHSQGVSPSTDPASSFRGAMRADDLAGQTSGVGFSLLDPSRLTINHSYSMSYFSGGGQSGSIGLYMSTLSYQFSKPLTLRVGLGYLHQPLGFLNNDMVGPEGGRILPNVQLDFRPTENMFLRLDYRTIPVTGYDSRAGMGWPSPLFDRWDR